MTLWWTISDWVSQPDAQRDTQLDLKKKKKRPAAAINWGHNRNFHTQTLKIKTIRMALLNKAVAITRAIY